MARKKTTDNQRSLSGVINGILVENTLHLKSMDDATQLVNFYIMKQMVGLCTF